MDHQMETFSAVLAHCAGNSLVTGEFPSQWPVTQWSGIKTNGFQLLNDLISNPDYLHYSARQ